MAAVKESEIDRLRRELERLQQQLSSLQINPVLDNVKDPCAIFDQAGRFVFVNRSAEALCRKHRQELLGRTVEEVFPVLAGTPVLEAVRRAAEKRESVRFEQSYPEAGIWLEGEAHPAAEGASVFVRDVTDRQRVAEELHRRNEVLRGITDQLPVIISQTDKELRIQVVNKAYEDFTGRPAEEAVGKHLRDVSGEPYYSIAEPYAARALSGERVSFESRIRHRDGSLRDVEVIYTPQLKSDGTTEGFLSLILDISERKRFERERERLVQELSTERARLAAIFDSFPAGVVFAEAPSGAITYVNPQVEQILGRVVAAAGDPRSSAGEAGAYESVLARAVAGRRVEGEELQYLRGDGRLTWIRLSGAPIINPQGTVVGGVAVFYDIDRERKALEALRAREREMATLLDNIPDIISRYDRDLRCVFVSPSIERHTGLRASFFIGKQNCEMGLSPELTRAWDANLMRIFETRHMDWSEFTIDGPRGPRHFNSIGVPEFGPDGEVVSVLTITHDVSQRKKALEALRASEQRLHIALETARMGAWERDFATGRMECSAQFKANFGLGPEAELTYEDIQRSIHPADQAGMQAAVSEAIANRSDYRVEYRVIWPDGSMHWILASGRALYDADRAIRMVGVTLETTERKLAEESLTRQAEELARSNADLQQFAYVTSHDLQEPLRTITSFAQMLTQRYRGRLDSDADEFLDYIVAGSRRMKNLIDALLAYSRVVNSETVPFAVVHLEAAVHWARMNLQSMIEETGANVTCEELPHVYADHVQLVQLFQNLIGNAIKYSKPGVVPEIHIQADRREQEWLIRVSDNGVGIAPQHHDRIFGVFKRLHGKDIPGTGIGLAICKRIVEKHNGRIWVESDPGRGSQFCFTLPY